MQLTDRIEMKGRLRLQLSNRKGEMVKEVAANNAIVLTGRDMVSRMFLGPTFALHLFRIWRLERERFRLQRMILRWGQRSFARTL